MKPSKARDSSTSLGFFSIAWAKGFSLPPAWASCVPAYVTASHPPAMQHCEEPNCICSVSSHQWWGCCWVPSNPCLLPVEPAPALQPFLAGQGPQTPLGGFYWFHSYLSIFLLYQKPHIGHHIQMWYRKHWIKGDPLMLYPRCCWPFWLWDIYLLLSLLPSKAQGHLHRTASWPHQLQSAIAAGLWF